MEDIKELLELYFDFVEENSKLQPVLSGSVALKILNRNIRRTPDDIDILVPVLPVIEKHFNIPRGWEILDVKGEYDDSYFTVYIYEKNNIKINIFLPNDDISFLDSFKLNYGLLQDTNWVYIKYEDFGTIKLLQEVDILTFKLKHSFDRNLDTYLKHYLDLQYYFNNNRL